MSTAAPSPPALPRRVWRRLRTMRTAIVLLLVLAAGAAVGSLIPQRPVSPLRVIDWIRDHPEWVPVAEKLGLFDVYGSWWFMAIYGLLLLSLAGCLVPRYRAFLRAVRARPRARRSLATLPVFHAGTVAVEPEHALGSAERVLRKRRFRTVREDGQVAAEKGHLREGGSLLFHTAFFVLLLGIAVGKLFGFTGQVAVVEGESFTDAPLAYDSLRTGRLFGGGHRGFTLTLDEFDVSWHPDGTPKEFVSRVRVSEQGEQVKSGTVRVNHPLVHEGVSVYQLAWGWAPHVRVERDGKVLADGPVVFLEDQRTGVFRGVVKVPGLEPELGLELWFYNDLEVTDELRPFNRSREPRNPFVFFVEHRGDLGLTRPQSIFELDKSRLVQAGNGAMPLGGSDTLDDGTTITFTELRQYSVFQVASDPGVPIALAAAVLILAGLIPSLYSSRRRVWVRAVADGDAARIEVGGLALQRAGAFDEEFKALVRDLGRDLRIGRG